MRKPKVILGCFFVVSFLLAACAPAAPVPAAPKSAPAKTSYLDSLYDAAKKEGGVVWHSAVSPDLFDLLIDTFQKKFAGIKVEGYPLLAPQLAPRIITEQQAGRVSTDVGTGSVAAFEPLYQRNLLVAHDYAGAGVDPKRIVLDSKGSVVRDMPWGVIYNTNQVAANDVPKKWEDLLNPKFQGRIGTQRTGAGWEGAASIWDEAKLMSFLTELKKQKPAAWGRSEDIIPRVASGELLIGIVVLTVVAEEQAKGAPLGLAPVGPNLSQPQLVSVIKDGPNPNAAKLFSAWAATAEATPGWIKANWGPLKPCDGPLVLDKFMCGKEYQILYEDSFEKAQSTAKIRKLVADTLGFTAAQ
ncbi:MAG: extracellular solute-binding protein [Chloroflexi bacterium]|nr:extracellular solute-binding protein [Chloroflexota bacterium]